MDSRFSLRFDSGERRGEIVALTGAGATVGRKPGNTIQLLDPSVSGRHAEIVVAADTASVRDLGSTNGTRVGGERVSEKQLAHGDAIVFGNVKLTFLDAAAEAPAPPVAKSSDGAAASAGEGVRQVSSAAVERSRGRPVFAIAGGVIAVGAALAGYAWWRGRSTGDGGSLQVAPVQSVPGNLLESGFSFEGDATSWTADDAAPAAFEVDSGSRRSGSNGLGVALDAGGYALARSAEVAASAGRGLVASAWLRTDGDSDARIGIEFLSGAGSAAPTCTWSSPLRASSEFEAFEFRTAVPRGYDRARVLLLARAGGAPGGVDADDVSLVAADLPSAPLAIDEYQLAALGDPATAATLFKIDRTLLSGIAAREPGDRATAPRSAFTASKRDSSVVLDFASSAPLEFDCTVEPALASLGVATLGASGHRAHQVEFERDDALGILCGAGKDFVRIAFAEPVRVTGRPEAGGFALRIALGTTRTVSIQVSFRAERDAAQGLARSAREAERAGRLGESLIAWRRLRDEYPYEPALVAEAETAVSNLLRTGADEARKLAKDMERAKFFRLVELYRAGRASARSIAARFAGSEIETAVLELGATIDADLAALERDLDRAEVARLEAIAAALDAGRSPKLAARVRAALDEMHGGR
jgi:hypothetical protein